MGIHVGDAAVKYGKDGIVQGLPAWADLRFDPRPGPMPGHGWKRRLPLALTSLAAHGLMIAALLQVDASQPVPGNSQTATERVQLRFVSAHSQLQEQGARTAASSSLAITKPQPAASRPVPPADPAAAVVEPAPTWAAVPVAVTEPAMVAPASMAASVPVAAPDNQPATHLGGVGRGQGMHGPGTAAQDSAPLQHSQGVADWSQAVMRQLARFRSYPASARMQRVEGVVMVHATIAADGQVLATRLRHSCGNPDLDAEALATFHRARRLPAPPAHLPSPLQVDLPVAFRLRS